MEEITLILNDLDDSQQLAELIYGILSQDRRVVALYGDIGSGKTFLCRQIIRSFYQNATFEVPSPTFNILITYEIDNDIIYHYDLFRLHNIKDVQEIGIIESIENNICLIEWPQLIVEMLDSNAIVLELQVIEHDKRKCILQADTSIINKISSQWSMKDI